MRNNAFNHIFLRLILAARCACRPLNYDTVSGLGGQQRGGGGGRPALCGGDERFLGNARMSSVYP